MKRKSNLWLFFALTCLMVNGCKGYASSAVNTSRERIRMDANWRFHPGDVPDSGGPAGIAVTNWRWIPVPDGQSPDTAMASPDLSNSGSDWQDVAVGADVFNGRTGYAWYRAVLPVIKTRAHMPIKLHFYGVDDNATVYLNGEKVFKHEGWNEPFDISISNKLKTKTKNTLAVLVQNTYGGGGLTGPVTIQMGSVSVPLPARPGYNDAAWQVVHLPHDYVAAGLPDPKADVSHGFRPAFVSWYRKTFRMPAYAKGKSVWIDFDGVYRDAHVWLNGHFLGEDKSGYMSFRYDITPYMRPDGANVLTVYVDPTKFEGWWYEGGGIYRHVWLNIADPVHVQPWGTLVTSSVKGVSTSNPSAVLSIRTDVVNKSANQGKCALISRIYDPSGKLVDEVKSNAVIPAKGMMKIHQHAHVQDAKLWSLEKPQLYKMVTLLQRDNRTFDQYETPFGIRTIRFDAEKGFFLNDKPVKLKGTCNHQDFAGVGVGMPDSVLYWRIKKLKSMGSNAYRCSHNPVASELLDACDKLGMLVMDENRHLGDTYSGKTPRGTPAAQLTDLSAMVRRDRNHPSIIMWSICNEEGLQGTSDGGRIARAMKTRVDELDGTRPVTAAMNGGHGEPGGFTGILDMEGYNYSPGGYSWFHEHFPKIPLFGSETGSTVSTRGIYENDPKRGYVSAYDVNFPGWAQTAEAAWQPIADRPYVAGGFVWTGFDYKGEPTPYGWPCINSHFGILDECGFPKDNFWYYLSVWGDKPIVHILPHWNWPGKEGQPISVWCYSNCDRVELFLNGESLGSKDMPKNGHLEWSVPYAPGKLEAKAYRGDTLEASDVVETTGEPAALRLKTDRSVLTADGEDVTMVEVAVVDAQGRVVPTADNLIFFKVSGAGAVAGVGNGDPSSHESDVLPFRNTFNGLCMVIVKAKENPGNIRLLATSIDLKSAALTLKSLKWNGKDVQ